MMRMDSSSGEVSRRSREFGWIAVSVSKMPFAARGGRAGGWPWGGR
jgi:hypothetical protein